MPRGPRSIIPGYVYHLTHRGNNKQQLFFNDRDYRMYLNLFEEAREKYKMRILGYCVMSNHVHYVALAQHEFSFAKTMNISHANYAKYFHKNHDTTGHVWQGRYHSCVLDNLHLFAALRYVERNPVRAGLVDIPSQWIWSSARSHISNDKGIITLEEHSSYIDISCWKDYIGESDNENDLKEIRRQTLAARAWGSEDFKKELESRHGILLSKKMGRPKKSSTSLLFDIKG